MTICDSNSAAVTCQLSRDALSVGSKMSCSAPRPAAGRGAVLGRTQVTSASRPALPSLPHPSPHLPPPPNHPAPHEGLQLELAQGRRPQARIRLLLGQDGPPAS